MKQRKKINAIVKYFWPVAAGIETNMLETYSVLAKLGWDITIFTTKDTHTQKNFLKDKENLRGLKIVRLNYWNYATLGFNWKNADLVCIHNFDLLPQLLLLTNSILDKILGKKKYKVFVTPHGGYTPEWRIFRPLQALIKKFIHYTVGALLINIAADGVRAVSSWERNEIVKHGVKSKLISTISNGIEDEAYLDVDKKASKEIKEKVKNFGKYLIQMGRIYPIKNYETTIHALTHLPNDINLVIAGPISDKTYLKKLKLQIADLNLQKRVFFAGVIRGVDKYYTIKHAQVMVHMAIWESFCNVVHEGMSQGLPCVVANNTALPLLIKNGKNGFCVETKDYKTLAEKVNFLLSNKNSQKVNEMTKLNKEFGLKESWQNVAFKMGNLYKAII